MSKQETAKGVARRRRGKSTKETIGELRAENRLLRGTTKAVAWASVLKDLIRYGCFAAIGFFAYKSIDSLAGRVTDANIFINFLGSLTVSKGLAYILGGGGMVYGIAQKRRRQKDTARLHQRIHHLEKLRDPD